MVTLAEQLIKSLQFQGVRYVFGIPGGPSIPYLEAMRKNGIEFVLVSNEQSAGIMADVCGRLTGVPGICHATFGPGATNLATGVGGALLDRSPLIAFTTEVKAADIGRKVQMNIDHQALFRPLTKWTTRLSRENFKETVTRAFQVAAAEAPGPVHVGLPSDIDGEMSDSIVGFYEKTATMPPNPDSLAATARLLQKVKKTIARHRLDSGADGTASGASRVCRQAQHPSGVDAYGQRGHCRHSSLLRRGLVSFLQREGGDGIPASGFGHRHRL